MIIQYSHLWKPIALLTVIFCVTVQPPLAAQPTLSWEQSYGGTMTEWLGSSVVSRDGGVIFGSWSASSDGDVGGQGEVFDMWVLKTDKEGQIQWSRALGGSDYEEGCFIAENADGSIWVVGETSSSDGIASESNGNRDILVVKLDQDGEIIYSKTFGGNGADDISGMVPTADGGLVFCCSSWSNTGTGDIGVKYGKRDIWLVKLDAEGGIQWQKTIGGSEHDSGQLYPAKDKGYWLVANSRSSDGHFPELNGQSDFWILRLDDLGNIRWKKRLGVPDDLSNVKVSLGEDGSLVTLQQKIGLILNDLMRYDDDGMIVEEIKEFPLIDDYQAFWINMEFIEGKGYFFNFIDSVDQSFIIHTDVDYRVKWKYYFEGSGFRYIYQVGATGPEELLVTGMKSAKPIRTSEPDEEIDIWAARLDLTTGVADDYFSNAKSLFSIMNPVASGTQIHIRTTNVFDVNPVISIYSMAGDFVLNNAEVMRTGAQELSVSHRLSPGAYVLRIDIGNVTESYVLIVQ